MKLFVTLIALTGLTLGALLLLGIWLGLVFLSVVAFQNGHQMVGLWSGLIATAFLLGWKTR